MPQPHWKTATITPYAAPMESRFISAALSGTTTERKTSISSRNDTADHRADEQRQRLLSWALRSSVVAVMPGT